MKFIGSDDFFERRNISRLGNPILPAKQPDFRREILLSGSERRSEILPYTHSRNLNFTPDYYHEKEDEDKEKEVKEPQCAHPPPEVDEDKEEEVKEPQCAHPPPLDNDDVIGSN